ncbi:hypothetical protein H4582DRAFT_1799931, partial [Lactarius indigo]
MPYYISSKGTCCGFSSSLAFVLKFLISPNLFLAPERAWDQTTVSRGKGPTLWASRGEEPRVQNSEFRFSFHFVPAVYKYIFTRKVILIPMHVLPVVGLFVMAVVFKALGTSRYLQSTFFFLSTNIEFSSVFGFSAALLEALPSVELIFSASNKVGTAMWTQDKHMTRH